ncbi:MAG: hypothetical protein OEW67_10925 [Cyclobacteriaceae bacterium]|nr:hypothetical protein [Cyclobacteriaceae bacterium]
MKDISNISKSKQFATLLLGVLIAFVLGIGETGYLNSEFTKSTVEQENNDEKDSAEKIEVISSVNAITASVLLHITHIFYFISENVLSDSSKISANYLEKPYLETYLSMVFKQIISPNAP